MSYLSSTRRFFCRFTVAASLALPFAALAGDGQTPPTTKIVAPQARVPKIQIALLLDNSGSMSGLLNQARTQLWAMVNEFSGAQQKGVRPRLEIAVYKYGEKPTLLVPFTSDLDKVSEVLFGMGIEGGDEYCGQVIQNATRQLEWSGNADDLKLIYIAGNEPFTQGPVEYTAAINDAKKKGITVNPIHCGGTDDSWNKGALFAGAKLMTIDHNAKVATITAPQDAELARLGGELNKTYVGYGSLGASNSMRQGKMDEAAASAAPAAAAQRAMAKSSANYQNDDWDLVDAKKSGKKIAEMKEEELPAELKGKSKEEREAFVDGKAKERAEIQKKIATLSAERTRFVAEAEKKAAAEGAAQTLDSALVESAKSAGRAKAFSF